MGRALRVAIVGGGAAGSTLASLLAGRGAAVTLFGDGRRPPLVVGESLVPAIIPIFRRLGIEEAVRALGVYKPGVTFAWGPQDVYRFEFPRFAGGPNFPPYAYNVPRPALDELLALHARRSGARIVDHRARFERTGDDAVGLDAATCAAAGMDEPPDFVVDATGRARVLARMLGIGERRGPRDDVAHFAHFTGFTWDEAPGQVVIGRLRAGWSWRIPLRGRLSVGVVLARSDAAALGGSPEERLERAIADDPSLSDAGVCSTRVSPVMTYGNYQLVSERGIGANWALVGDAFGFVDPMLSPGVFLAMRSAELLARAIDPAIDRPGLLLDAGAVRAALADYERTMQRDLLAWMELVGSIYEGRLLGLYRVGTQIVRERDTAFNRFLEHHIGHHVAGMASGARTTSRYSRGLIRFLARHGMRGTDPREMAIR